MKTLARLYGLALLVALPGAAWGALPTIHPPHGSLVLYQDSSHGAGTNLEIYRWDSPSEKFISVWNHHLPQMAEFQFQAFASGNAALLLHRGGQPRLYHVDLRSPSSSLTPLPSPHAVAMTQGWDGGVLVATTGRGLTRVDEEGRSTILRTMGALKSSSQYGEWDHIQEIGQDRFVTVNNQALVLELYDLQLTGQSPALSVPLDRISVHPVPINQAPIDGVRQIVASPRRVWMSVQLASLVEGLVAIDLATGDLAYEEFSGGSVGTLLDADATNRLSFVRLLSLHQIDPSGTLVAHTLDFFTPRKLQAVGIHQIPKRRYLANSLSWSWPKRFRKKTGPLLIAQPKAQPPLPDLKPAPPSKPKRFALPDSFTARELVRWVSPYTPISEQAPEGLRELMYMLTSEELRHLGLYRYGKTYEFVDDRGARIIAREVLEGILLRAAGGPTINSAHCADELKSS